MTPPAPSTGIQDAARFLAEGQTADAEGLLDRLVRDFPTYVTAHVLLAKAREANGRSELALEAWHAAYFLMPGSPLVTRERARLLRADPSGAPPDAPIQPHVPVEAVEESGAMGDETAASEPTEFERIESELASPEVTQAETVEAEAGGKPEADEAEVQEPEVVGPADMEKEAAPASDASETEASRGENEPVGDNAPVVGSAPNAWVRDVQPEASASGNTHEDQVAPDVDWKIVGETPTPRAASAEPVEPTVAPPVGHRSARPGASDTSAGRFVEDEFATASATPETPLSPDAASEAEDLDALIEQLENAPRIRPDLNALDDDGEAEEAEENELVSETLARIYAAQGQYDEAARAYDQLASKHPGRATELLGKAAEMRRAAGADS